MENETQKKSYGTLVGIIIIIVILVIGGIYVWQSKVKEIKKFVPDSSNKTI